MIVIKNIPFVNLLKTIIYYFLVFHSNSTFGQLNQWVWMGGTDTIQSIGSFGIKGIPDDSNVPCSRSSSVTWRDSDGHQKLLGGYGKTSVGIVNLYQGDLWNWDGDNWTFLKDSIPSYGIKNVASTTNYPGRRVGSLIWQVEDKVYLFGGIKAFEGYLNDLWILENGIWTWISGEAETKAYGIYGIKNVATSVNTPGSRYHSISWVDRSGNLWLYGGFGYASEGDAGELNDLWKFDGANWTWVNGDDKINILRRYGLKGIPSPLNTPGGRFNASSWIDQDDNLWLFGGSDHSNNDLLTYLNDLWKWDGQDWTWVKGSSSIYQPGVYGSIGIADDENIPGARQGSTVWENDSGEIYLFGGFGIGRSQSPTFGSLNDLWRWDGKDWTWISGASDINKFGSYGTKKIASDNTFPGSRTNHTSWSDEDGNLWLFGGQGKGSLVGGTFGYLNDLWKYNLYCDPKIISKQNENGYTIIEESNIITQNCSKLIVRFDPTGSINNIKGRVNASVWIDQIQNPQYVKRHYQITPEINPENSNSKITLYFTQEEFDSYNALINFDLDKLPTGPEDNIGISNIIIEKFTGLSADGTGLPESYTGTSILIDPNDSEIVWNNNFKYWEVTLEVFGFSGFFVKTSKTLKSKTNIKYDIKVYPNPTRDIINFEIDPGLLGTQVEIIDNFGIKIKNFGINKVKQQYNINGLKNGIYFIKFDNGLVKKLIIY